MNLVKLLSLVLAFQSWSLFAQDFQVQRRHQNIKYFDFKKENNGKKSPGSFTQNSTLLGKYRLELVLGELYGQNLLGYRFIWDWKENFTISTLGHGINESTFEKYPALYNQLRNIKPIYIKIKVPIEFRKDRLTNEYRVGRGNLTLLITGDRIYGYSDDPYGKDNRKNRYEFLMPSWKDSLSFTNAKYDTKHLRYRGRYQHYLMHGKEALSSEYMFSYAQEFSINKASVEIVEIQWPDQKIKEIYRQVARKEYEGFKTGLKGKGMSRAALAQELKKDAHQTLFWDGVNINLEEYETSQSTQSSHLKKKLRIANQWYSRADQRIGDFIDLTGMNVSEIIANINKTMNKSSTSTSNFPSLTSNNIQLNVTKHFQKDIRINYLTNNRPKKVEVSMNDIIVQKARKDGSSRKFKTHLLFNYGANEVKVSSYFKYGKTRKFR